jgi:pyruvate kinase
VFAAKRDNVTDLEVYDDIAVSVAKDFGFKSGETIIITSGWRQQHGSTNTLRIIDIP